MPSVYKNPRASSFSHPGRRIKHLKRLAPQTDLQGFLDDHHVCGFFYLALPVAPHGEFFDGISHGE